MSASFWRALGWPAALLLLAWLYSQSAQVDSSLHVRTVGHFEQLQQQDARLNQYVLQARFHLLRNYDPMVATQQRIAQLLRALEADKPRYFSAGETPVQREFMRYRALFDSKFALIEDFKSHNAVLRNSVQYFPLAIRGLLAGSARSPQRLDLLHDLLESVLLYDLASADQHSQQSRQRQHIEQVLKQLMQAAPDQAPELETLARHVTIILDYRGEVDQLTKDITQLQSTEEADALFAAYGALYTQRQQVADRYRLALAVLALAILGYVAWTLLALRRARHTLTDSLRELKFQKFALDAHSIVSVADRSGKIIEINDKFTEISQYRRDELIGQDHRVLNSGYHPHEFFKSMWATIGHGQVWHGEVKNRRKDGSFYWVDSTIVPFMDEAAKVLRYVSIRTDITERKQADERLQQQRAFYESISETLGEGLYVQDAQGHCVYMNSEAERLLGWQRDEFLGRPVHDTIHTQTAEGGALPGRDCPIMLAIQSAGVATMEDQVFVRKDGSVFPVALISRAALDADGQVQSLVVAFSDITERKRAEQAMRAAKEAAEQAARVKGDFLANMSHEIRTPMNGIIGMTNLALDTDLNAEQREYIGLVKSSADALLMVINDILDFSKIESGKMNVESIEFSLESMLRDAVKSMAVRAHQKNLELLLHIATDVPDRVRSDPGRLRQVIVNLVGNAIKFTERGEVEVSVQCLSGAATGQARLLFSVRDTGIGIAADKFDVIFDSFSQADTSTTRKYGGTGLGLTISHQLVQLMGGHIALESTPGQGSRFYFSLDLPVVESRVLGSYRKTGRIAGLPVLVVDDNQSNRRLLLELLQQWQMRPVAVANATQALAELERASGAGEPYALALLDVQMPEMDGFELAQKMLHERLGVSAIMMVTSQGQRGDAQRCRELGLSAYLTKPVAASDLLDAIMTTLGEPESSQSELVTRHTLRENRLKAGLGQRSLKLLLAEDNAVNQRLASILLGRLGHQLSVVSNGREALQAWQQTAFDAILMDVDMPEMNGYEATARVRAIEQTRGGHVPIIAITAHAMQGVREDCLAHGMDGYVSKPIDADALQLELQALLPTVVSTLSDAPEPATLPAGVANFAELRQTVGDDKALFDELVALYRTDAPRHLQQLHLALAQNDAQAIRHSAHAIRGMVAVFAAAPTMAVAQQLEQQAGAQDCTALVEQLEQCLKAVDQALAQYVW